MLVKKERERERENMQVYFNGIIFMNVDNEHEISNLISYNSPLLSIEVENNYINCVFNE